MFSLHTVARGYSSSWCLLMEFLLQAKLCVEESIPVVPIPGPCAFVSALSASGLPTNEFSFGIF